MGGVRGARRGGVSFFIENPRRGWAEGQEGVCGELGNFFGGGGLNFFFRCRNVHQGMHSGEWSE